MVLMVLNWNLYSTDDVRLGPCDTDGLGPCGTNDARLGPCDTGGFGTGFLWY